MALTLLFIGCGNMGAAIAGGAIRHLAGARLVALDPNVERARGLLPAGVEVELHSDGAALVDLAPDLVILAVKPQSFATLPPEIMALMAKAPVVSIMAGVPLARLAAGLGHARVIRVMPNLPALVGMGMSLGCTATDLLPNLYGLIEVIFESIGRFEWVADEDAFERANPVFSCGPGFVFAFAEQMIAASIAQGVPAALAEALVRQTFLGAATMLAEDTRGATGLKRAVSSPGGTTLAGLAVFEADDAMPRVVPAMLQAAHARALQLAREGA